ncbi:MAG TPA: hypothetical protein VJO53_04130 [Candidatus Acidoferrales bacterium]|nr:hypothetical protein [Candidatus Acidoferrales bacterium]
MKRPYLLISGAWLIHAAAWFLPVVKGGVPFPHGLPGWEAFRVASSAVWPYEGVVIEAWYYAVLSTLSALTTLLFIVGSPWAVLRGSRSLQSVSAWAAAISFILNAHWYVLFGSDRSDLRIGYFLWWLSFIFLALGSFDLAGRNSEIEARKRDLDALPQDSPPQMHN